MSMFSTSNSHKVKISSVIELSLWIFALLCVGSFIGNHFYAHAQTQAVKESYSEIKGPLNEEVIDSKTEVEDETIGFFSMASLDIEAAITNGTQDAALDKGIGRVRGTSYFGLPGNVALAGHRDTFFRNLQHVKVGDEIEVKHGSTVSHYVVTGYKVVEPTNTSILMDTEQTTLTLITCFPFNYVGSAPQRFIVFATKIAPNVH
ncbi:class D sortase [Brumicola blandensis]|uniref:Class D sortase n=1 Tax=Brumicola blandensis TaxID=3075611 RepID=A0AAW8QY59_9ALTE|nr:class D sortase [Alteromonas sp. W409]MDT0581525.1 class D sortase [Alteromonas sp. W409]